MSCLVRVWAPGRGKGAALQHLPVYSRATVRVATPLIAAQLQSSPDFHLFCELFLCFHFHFNFYLHLQGERVGKEQGAGLSDLHIIRAASAEMAN